MILWLYYQDLLSNFSLSRFSQVNPLTEIKTGFQWERDPQNAKTIVKYNDFPSSLPIWPMAVYWANSKQLRFTMTVVMREYSPKGSSSGGKPGYLLFCVQREVMLNELASWSVARKFKNWKLGDIKVFVIITQVGLWEWIQSVKNFVLYSFAQQTLFTQLLELNTQEWLSQLTSSGHCDQWSATWAHE